jgi:hypothetical protein
MLSMVPLVVVVVVVWYAGWFSDIYPKVLLGKTVHKIMMRSTPEGLIHDHYSFF